MTVSVAKSFSEFRGAEFSALRLEGSRFRV